MSQQSSPRQVEFLPIEALQPDPRNPKAHDSTTIEQSIERFGMMDPIVRDERTGYIVSGHGRMEALKAMRDRGDTPPDGVRVGAEDTWLVPVITGWASRSDAEAGAALIALNRTTELGGWVDEALLELLQELGKHDGGLEGVGYLAEDIEALQASIDADPFEDLDFDDQDAGHSAPGKQGTEVECPSCSHRFEV